MRRALDRQRRFGIFLFRVTLGVYYLLHAYYGGEQLGIEDLAGINVSYGIPFPTVVAYGVVIGHLVGGAMILIGLYARIGALLNLPIMAGAMWFVHWDQGFFMRGITAGTEKVQAIGWGFEYSLLLFIATVVLLFTGSGSFAVDSIQRRHISLD